VRNVGSTVRRDPFPLPHIILPCLLESGYLGNCIQEPLDLPSRYMAHISTLEDISLHPGHLSALVEPLGQAWQDGRALLSTLAI